MERFDFLVIGAGIAGASVAYWLAPHGRVLVLERESQPGYHSTGRSAALFMASYGSAQVRALSRASLPFFATPPAGFSDQALTRPRGALMVAPPGFEAQLEAHWQVLQEGALAACRLTPAQVCAMVPVLRAQAFSGAVFEQDAADLDVHALHQGFLRGLRQQGGVVRCDAEVVALRRAGGGWQVQLADGRCLEARVVLNAAGAWADAVASMAGVPGIGLQPCRRTAFVFAPPAGVDIAGWPMVYSAAGDWYFKPDAGLLLASPANADPVAPHDVQPEDLDVALAMHAIGEMTTLSMHRPVRVWAGLRSFVADSGLVGGPDPVAPDFIWAAAQGGYGIQTAPAFGQACAALARGVALPESLRAQGLDAKALGPERLQKT